MRAWVYMVYTLAALVGETTANADVGARLTLSSMFYTESSDKTGADADGSNTSLGYVDLRGIVDATHLPYGFEAHGDFRLRLTGNFDENAAWDGQPQVTARGYSGGREYDLRELYVAKRGSSFDVALGRMIVREADALTVDGTRLWWRPSTTWNLSLFGGFYPNPYARSLTDDYSSSLALAFGADVAYQHPRIWGSASVVGSYLGGPDDGGTINPLSPAAPAGRTETPRVYLTWTNFLRIVDGLSLFHDIVVDAAGAAGPQLTRLDVGAHVEGKHLRIDAAYDHYSSLAVELYLQRLLQFYDRRNWLPGTIENNLVIQRTARDEGRLRISVRPLGRLDVYGVATLRRRALLDAEDDPNFAGVAPDLAFDLTVGVRDDGDLLGLRLGAAFTEISGYRAETRLVTADAGRDFFDERLSFDLHFGWESNRDFHDGAMPACTTLGPMMGGLGTTCFGTRTGTVIEGGATLMLRLAARWFFLLDYLAVYDTDDGGQAILSHVGFLRVEVKL